MNFYDRLFLLIFCANLPNDFFFYNQYVNGSVCIDFSLFVMILYAMPFFHHFFVKWCSGGSCQQLLPGTESITIKYTELEGMS